ncbi:hypothetical protein OK18_08490 [Chryseobacterium gallinarum]|uniref:Lipoprotein n=1 Tax=Chryseobacterium gallinarum TaxID=1324352 RepID=A0A0G3M1C1_CHRGL|nr:hypothetical protein [Chryseobacterium gallinarum]AKK72654.1 hypothetical protein OK18_08490 [Chryseobacterium gallinarum]
MKLQHIYIITFFIFFSCKGNNDLNKKQTSIAKENSSSVISIEDQNNTKRYKFNTISQNPIVDIKKESREQIINRFRDSEVLINFNNKTFQAGKECTFEYFEKKVSPIKYWYNQSTINIYKEELAKIGISLPKEFSVFMSANPNKTCEYPTSEYILIEGKIIFIYEGYLIVFGNDLDKFEQNVDNSSDQNIQDKKTIAKNSERNIILPVSKEDLLNPNIQFPIIDKKIIVEGSEASSVYKLANNTFLLWFDGDNERWYVVTFVNNQLFNKLLIGKSETIESENGKIIDNYIDFNIGKDLEIKLKYSTGKKIKKIESYQISDQTGKIEKLL